MINSYKDNLSNNPSNASLLDFKGGIEDAEYDEDKKKLITNYDFDFNHSAFQNAIATCNNSDIFLLLSEFRNFYAQYRFKPNETNISSICSILIIIEQRNPDIKELTDSCFSALHCLFLSKIDPSILIQANILNILHQYLTNPKVDDIIPSLKVIKYLVQNNECEIILEHFSISVFTKILKTFNHKKIYKMMQRIFICFFETIERIRNNEQMDLDFYLKEINELFNSTFYILNKEIRAFSIHNKNHKCAILSLYLNLFYKLIQNNEGFCPDLNANLMGNSISPMFFFNSILHECDYVKPVKLTIKILIEVIHNHFRYFDLNAAKRIQYFLLSSPSEIQSLSIKYFFTLIQKISRGNSLIDPSQLESLRGLIYELNLYPIFIEILRKKQLFYNSVDYTIQSLDVLLDFLSNYELLSSYDQEMIEYFCLMLNGILKPETLDSILNIFSKLFDFLTATNIEQRDLFVQVLINNLDQETIDLVIKSEKMELSLKAQAFFGQIHELASSYSEF